MKTKKNISNWLVPCFVLYFCFQNINHTSAQNYIQWFVPINANNRQSFDQINLTSIGHYGVMRNARPNIPAHLHTGIDIMRPGTRYDFEPIYSVTIGRVISIRDDGPFAQIIIEHTLDNSELIWTVYEHVAGIEVYLGQIVDPFFPIARFMNQEELNKYGWQFDHFHLEILRIKPRPLSPDEKKPFHYYGTYCLVCYNELELKERYYNPHEFFLSKWGGQ